MSHPKSHPSALGNEKNPSTQEQKQWENLAHNIKVNILICERMRAPHKNRS